MDRASLDSLTVMALRALAREMGITGVSRTRKDDLIAIILAAPAAQPPRADFRSKETHMDRAILTTMSLAALRALAHELGIGGADRLDKDALIATLVQAPAGAPAASPIDRVSGAPDLAISAPASQPAQAPGGARLSELGALPARYGATRVVLLVQKPRYLYTYWEITDPDLDRARAQLGPNFHLVLRVREMPGGGFFDIEVHSPVGDWFFSAGTAWETMRVDVGLRGADGRFVLLASSDAVAAPAYRPSERTDPEWAIAGRDFETIYALSGGISERGGSEQIQRILREGWAPSVAGSAIASRS
ncbi:MAG: DUF4912 domain-containing protein [Nitrospirae bacterium]|nr:DUF4912 domain-containing protein [Nitrospirota bacterium]